jgi:hypothetical protein
MTMKFPDERPVDLEPLLDVVTVAVALREMADWLTVWACLWARHIKATGPVANHLRASKRWVQVLARVGCEFPGFVPTTEQAMSYAVQAGCLRLWDGKGSVEPDFEAGLCLEHFRQAVRAEQQSPLYWIEKAAAEGWSARELAMEIAADEGKEVLIPYLTRHKCRSEIDGGKIVLTPLGEWAPSGKDPEALRVTATEVTK